MQAVEKMLDIDRIRQQAALHNRLEELGIPRIFQKGKQGYTGEYLDTYPNPTVQTNLSQSCECS